MLSLAAIAVGGWLIATEHAKDAVCNAHNGQITGIGMSSNCLTVVGSYFAGFALVVVGVLALVTTLSVMRKRSRNRGG